MKLPNLLSSTIRKMVFATSALAVGFTAPLSAQVSYTGGVYSQSFDSLANTGTTNVFTDGETLTGWHALSGNSNYTGTGAFTLVFPASPTTGANDYRADNGASNTGDLFSFGASGATDRALGSIGSGTPFDFYYGVAISNSTGSQLTSFTITYDGEQWRRGGQTATPPAVAQQRPETLFVYYRIGGSTLDNSGTWIPVTALDFISPNAAAADTASATLDGNAAANRTAGITATITTPVAANETIWIMWVDVDNQGSDHGMSIDNFVFTGTSAAAGAPVISSSTSASVQANTSFTYTIVASPTATSFGASPLPAGLTVDSATGVISGTPTTPGTYAITLTATNANGSGGAVLNLTVDIDPDAASIIASQVVDAVLNTEMTPYQVQAGQNPTSYTIGTLPAGLSFDTTTGILSGTPTVTGNYTVTVTATNAAGTGSGSLTIQISSPPIITSETSGSAFVNSPFAYTAVVASQPSNPPTSTEWTGLPAGMEQLTALEISGTPTVPGDYPISLAVTNAIGTTNFTFTLKVIDQATQDAIPTSVVVNEFVNATPDRIELLVVGDGTAGSTADLRGMVVKDFSGSIVSDNGGKFTFAIHSLWSAVPAGTLVVLSNGTTETEDLDASDYVLRVNLGNTTYFTGVGSFDIATTDMVMIKAAGYGTLGTAGGIHALASGVADPLPTSTTVLVQFRNFTGKKLSATATTATGNGVFATTPNSLLTDYVGLAATGATALADLTFGTANTTAGNTTNSAYIESLRAPTVTPLETWRSANFPGSDALSGIGADTADFDGDGLSNLLEYATDLDPVLTNTKAKVAGPSPVVVATVTTIGGTFLTLSYPKNPAATDLTYTVQATNDLGVTFTTGTGTTIVNGNTVTYTDDVPLNSTNARRFLRLQVAH